MFGAEPKQCLNQGKTNTNRGKIFALPGIYIPIYIYTVYIAGVYIVLYVLCLVSVRFFGAVSL